MIKAKLIAENASDLKDATIEEIFSECVGKSKCIKIAKMLRDMGLLILKWKTETKKR